MTAKIPEHNHPPGGICPGCLDSILDGVRALEAHRDALKVELAGERELRQGVEYENDALKAELKDYRVKADRRYLWMRDKQAESASEASKLMTRVAELELRLDNISVDESVPKRVREYAAKAFADPSEEVEAAAAIPAAHKHEWDDACDCMRTDERTEDR